MMDCIVLLQLIIMYYLFSFLWLWLLARSGLISYFFLNLKFNLEYMILFLMVLIRYNFGKFDL